MGGAQLGQWVGHSWDSGPVGITSQLLIHTLHILCSLMVFEK